MTKTGASEHLVGAKHVDEHNMGVLKDPIYCQNAADCLHPCDGCGPAMEEIWQAGWYFHHEGVEPVTVSVGEDQQRLVELFVV